MGTLADFLWSDDSELEKTAAEDQVLADTIVDEIEKVASAEGISLSDLSEDELNEVIEFVVANMEDETETEKVASDDVSPDEAGRIMAHAFMDELQKTAAAVEDESEVLEFEDDDHFEKTAAEHALELLDAANALAEEQEKTAGALVPVKGLTRAQRIRAAITAELKRVKDAPKHLNRARQGTGAMRRTKKAIKDNPLKKGSLERRLAKQTAARDRNLRTGLRGMVAPGAALGVTGAGVGMSKSKKASVDDVTYRAFQMLDEEGFDIELIADLLDNAAE